MKFANNIKIDTTVNLLLVDDEDFNREYLCRLLSPKYKNVFTASNGEKALEIINSKSIDILITDIKMPEMDGISLAKECKKRYPNLPVILLTAYKDEDYLMEAININIDYYLTKPVDIDELITLVGKLIKQIITDRTVDTQKQFIDFMVHSTKNLVILIRNRNIIAANKAFLEYFFCDENKGIYHDKDYDLPLPLNKTLKDSFIKDIDKYTYPKIIKLYDINGDSRFYSLNYAEFDDETGIMYFNDIDSLIKTQRELGNQRHRLEMILENMGEGVIACDSGGNVSFVNTFAEKFIKNKNSVGLPVIEVLEFVDENDNIQLNPVTKSLENTASCFNHQSVYVMNNENEKIPVDYIVTPIIDKNGNLLEVVIIIKDLTYKKLTESNLLRAQKLESIGVLAGGIAHDFNNLLTILYNYIHLANMLRQKKEKVYEFLSKAECTLDSTRQLTEKLITFSEAGSPIRSKLDLHKTIKEICDLVFAGSNSQFEINSSGDNFFVYADLEQIKQLFFNILENAIEAMPNGGKVQLNLSSDHLLDGEYIKVKIKDEGKGIPLAIKEKIFDPYFTTKEMDSRKGSGLGLSICYSIINKHDGRISFESVEGRGTEFYVYLPKTDSSVMP